MSPDRGVERRKLLKRAGALAAAGTAGVILAPDRARATESAIKAYDVREYGAAGTGGTDDTKPIQEAIDGAAVGGGVVFFPPGNYVTGPLTLRADVHLRGSGLGASVLTLAPDAGDDAAVLTSDGFADLAGGTTAGGISRFSLRDLVIDGSRDDCPESTGIRVYGFCYEIADVIVRNCGRDGIYSQWGAVGQLGERGDELEAMYSGIRSHGNGGDGVAFNGPHDSMFVNCLAFHNDGAGFRFSGVSHGCQLANVHSWGSEQEVAFAFESNAISGANCYADIDGGVGILVTGNECNWVGGRVIGSRTESGREEVGIQIGTGEPLTPVAGCVIDTYVQNCRTTAVLLPPDSAGGPGGDGGWNSITARLFQQPTPDDPDGQYGFVQGVPNPTTRLEVTQGIRDTLRNAVAVPAFDLRAELDETPAPAAESARVFARVVDGKTQLCVRLPSGAVKVLAEDD